MIIRYGNSISSIVNFLQYKNEPAIFVNTADIETTRFEDGQITIWGDTSWKDVSTINSHPLYNAHMLMPAGTVFFTAKLRPCLDRLLDEGNDLILNNKKVGVKITLDSTNTGQFTIYWVNPINNKETLENLFGERVSTIDLTTLDLINYLTCWDYFVNIKGEEEK